MSNKHSTHSKKNTDYDVVVIGAGLLGCFTARALSKYKLRMCVLEAKEDVCTGVSKANSSIVYAGYDMKPNTMKACMTVRANENFELLCNELGVKFSRCGSLMVAFGPNGCKNLQDKYEQGVTNDVCGLRLLCGSEAREIEPALSNNVQAALFSPSVGTVMPWDLCIAAAENAAANGVEFYFGAKVVAIHNVGESYNLETENGNAFSAKAVVNCAGICADKIANLAGFTRVHIALSKAEYVVYDSVSSRKLKHVIFHEPEGKGKGITAVPCIDGHVIVEGPKEDAEDGNYYSVTRTGLRKIFDDVENVLPQLADASVIASFAGARPNPRIAEKDASGRHKSINDFCIEYNHEKPNFVSFVGVKTPGLTCANELGTYGASLVVAYLNGAGGAGGAGGVGSACDDSDACDAGLDSGTGGVCENKEFSPTKRAPLRPRPAKMCNQETCSQNVHNKDACSQDAHNKETCNQRSGNIVCTCEGVYEEEIVHAIAMGARTIDGVKQRTGAHMGNCQGSGCEIKIAHILARELNIPLHEVRKNGESSYLFSSGASDFTLDYSRNSLRSEEAK